MQRHKQLLLSIVSALLLLVPLSARAQYPIVNAEEVKAWMSGKKKVMLIDTRNSDEYRAGHISGAVNIPAERISAEASRLPKNKSVPLIFYCRGAG